MPVLTIETGDTVRLAGSVTITVIPALTCRKTGSDLGAATALAWSTDTTS